MSHMIGVFCFESTWKGWSDAEMSLQLGRLRDLGVNVIATETADPPARLIRAAGEADLRTYVSVPCFSAHAWPHLIEGMDLHPVQADGTRRRQMEWYTGLIPTHEGYNRALAERISAIAEAQPAGLILDFIRWPLHWELELRSSTDEPDESSFDATSIAAFAKWLEERDAAPVHKQLDATIMLGPLRELWTEFKCDVITRFVNAAATTVRAIDSDITLGAFIVPATHEERRRLVGQDVVSLSACLDVLFPMTYHAILQQPPALVARAVRDISERSSAPVIPVVQVSAERDVADPWDWGASFAPGELGRIVVDALGIAPGVVLFSLEGLDDERRGAIAATLRSLDL
jgi:hypothetical protein